MNYLKSLNKILNHPLNKDQKVKTLIRSMLWKINQLTIKKPAAINLIGNVKCICYPSSAFGSLVVYTKLPEYQEMKMVYDLINDKSVFIDIGANIGVYSILAASKISKGKVFAFEPDKNSVKNLYKNLQINNLTNKVEVVEKVVSDKNGRVLFNFEKTSEINHISYNDERGKGVNSITLDTFLVNKKINSVDILKIDVEGAEIKVLRGAKKLLAKKNVQILIIEVNKNSYSFGSSPFELIEYINRFGYGIYFFNKKGKLEKISPEKIKTFKTFNIICFSKK